MTSYGFDLDNTLDHPEIAQLANDLHDAGHEVHVITGGLADAGEWTLAAREQKLAALGVRYTTIARCLAPDRQAVGVVKGQACARLGIAVLIDDDARYLAAVATVSDAARLLVLPC